MSGLIWSGIGQGIANAGQTIGGMMMKDIEYQRQLQAEDRKETNYLKRLEEAQRIKDEAAEAKAEALQQQVIKETTAAQAAGAEAPGVRRLSELRAKAGPGEGEDALPDEVLKKLIKDDPSLRRSYEESGLITRKDERLERAEGAIASAMAAGASSTTIKNLQALRTATLDEIKQEFKETKEAKDRAETNRRLDQTDVRLELLGKDTATRERNAETYASRALRGGAGGGSDRPARVQKTITGENGNVMAVMSDGTTRDLNVKSGDFNKQISNLITRMAADDSKFRKLPEDEKRKLAEERWRGQVNTQLGSSNRPALSTFNK